MHNLATPKLLAIDALNAAVQAPLELGTPVPGSTGGRTADACSQGYGCDGNDALAADSKIFWSSYSFRSSDAAAWTVRLSVSHANSGAMVAVYVDGKLLGTKHANDGALSFSADRIEPGLHGVIVRAVDGNFSVNSVAVALN